jgi:tetratricopeptide (TPR) repeat protein
LFLARPHDIFDLFTDQIEALACPICGTEKSLKPSLLAVSLITNDIIYLDRGAGQAPIDNLQKNFASILRTFGLEMFTVTSVADYEHFQVTVAKYIKEAASLFPDFPSLALDSFVSKWRRCQGEVFAAVATCAAQAVPSHRAVFKDPDSGDVLEYSDVLELLSLRSEQTVFLLACSLIQFHLQKTSVEEYLLRLVETSPFLTRAADEVLQKVALARKNAEQVDPNHDNVILWFQMYALESSLHLFLKRPYSLEAEWAQAFLQLHIAAQAQAPQLDELTHLRLSEQRVLKTIPLPAAFNAAARVLVSILQRGLEDRSQEFVNKWLRVLEGACDAFGREGLFHEVVRRGFAIVGPETNSPADLARFIGRISEKYSAELAIGMISFWIRAGSWREDPDSLDSFASDLVLRFKESPIARARILQWFGEQMKELRLPARSLRQLGKSAADWEYSLPEAERRALWTERVNTLRLVGLRREALAIAEEVLKIAVETLDEKSNGQAGDLSIAWLNYGILLRENGRPEEAIEPLIAAVRLAPEAVRPGPLESLGWTLLLTGRAKRAAVCFGEARRTFESGNGGGQYQALLIAEAVAVFNREIDLPPSR